MIISLESKTSSIRIFKKIIKNTKMDKPPIKEKPIIKSKPISLKSNQESTVVNKKKHLKSDVNEQSSNVLDKSRLNKAFLLLNQSNLKADKDDNRYDIRVDADQIETCNQIISLLFKAGYLRSNIIGLSEFDKVCLLLFYHCIIVIE